MFLLFVMSVMVFRIQKIRMTLAGYRTAWREVREELNIRRRDDPLRHIEEEAHNEGEEEGNDGLFDNFGVQQSGVIFLCRFSR